MTNENSLCLWCGDDLNADEQGDFCSGACMVNFFDDQPHVARIEPKGTEVASAPEVTAPADTATTMMMDGRIRVEYGRTEWTMEDLPRICSIIDVMEYGANRSGLVGQFSLSEWRELRDKLTGARRDQGEKEMIALVHEMRRLVRQFDRDYPHPDGDADEEDLVRAYGTTNDAAIYPLFDEARADLGEELIGMVRMSG